MFVPHPDFNAYPPLMLIRPTVLNFNLTLLFLRLGHSIGNPLQLTRLQLMVTRIELLTTGGSNFKDRIEPLTMRNELLNLIL